MKKCEICSRTEKEVRVHRTNKFGGEKLLCGKHYNHLLLHGEIKERGIRDKNEFVVDGDIVLISLYNNKSEKIVEAKVSKRHFELVQEYKWTFQNGYAITRTKGDFKYLHILIAEELFGKVPEGLTVDHKNINSLDNTDDNLRIADRSLQSSNQNLRKDNKTGYKGIFKFKEKWFAQMSRNGIRKRKQFDTFEEAFEQRKIWENN